MQDIIIYTDGSSRGNPGPGGYGAICLYPNASGEMRVDELGGREDSTTNNRMELLAAISALKHFDGYYDQTTAENLGLTAHVHTDSAYVLQGISTWIHGWKRNKWITSTKEPVKNDDLWKKLDEVVVALMEINIPVTWHKVSGHSGVVGNERCDEIATSFADRNHVDLYSGALSRYFLPDLQDITSNMKKRSRNSKVSGDKLKSKSSSKTKKAYSYVSMIDDEIYTDKTWVECEKRVKGKSGAKYKKSISAADEKNIIAEFKAF